MSNFFKNHGNNKNGDPRWKILETLYDNWQLKKGHNVKQIIPKRIHQIWLGGDLPEKYVRLAGELKKINSEYEYRLWTDKDVKGFNLKNLELFSNIENKGSKSDIFRLEILEKYGGIYLDTDFEAVKPFDDLINLDFFSSTGHSNDPEVINSIIASAPNNKIISKCVEELQRRKSFVRNDIASIMYNTGPYFLTRIFFNHVDISDNYVVFPNKYLAPLHGKYRNRPYDKKFIHSFTNENTYCIHLWHTTWQK